MYSFFKETTLVIIFLLCLCFNPAYGQSNFEFFFKDSGQYQDVVVDEVLSADTFRLQGKVGEKGELIKLIGLKAPEAPKKKAEDIKRNEFGIVIKEPVSPLTPIEEKAYSFAKELLEGKHIRLEFDDQKMGDDYATLAYAFLLDTDLFVNSEILRNGYANLSIRPPNTKYADELRDAYKEARSEQRGIQGQ